MTELSIIIPAYNEEERLKEPIIKAKQYLDVNFPNYEMILVDDGSTDDTAIIASGIKALTVLKLPKNQGKGAAVKAGMLHAKGKFRVFSDTDFSTPIYELPKLLNTLKSGIDVAIGSRALNQTLIKEHQPFYREMMGKTFNKIVQLLVVKGISDTQCGFKGFTEKAAETIFSQSKINGFAFDVEIVYLANKLGFSLKEIPVEWYNDERSKVNPITDSIKMILEILKIRNLHK